MTYDIRPMQTGDEAFVFSTMLLGLYYGNELFSEIDKDTFFKEYHKVLEHVLPRSTVRVACLKEDPDVILGYSVSKDTCLDWVFVKRPWRKMGIASALAPEAFDTYSHITTFGKSLLKTREWKFNPFAINYR